MKINELNMFQNMLGKVGQAASAIAKPTNTQGVGSAMARAKKSGLSPEDQLAQDIFIKKFVSRGANALNTAIQQDLVDVNSSDLGAGNATAQPTTPSAGTTPSAPQAGGTATQAPGTAAGAQPGAAPKVTPVQPGGKAPGNQAVPAGQKKTSGTAIDISVKQTVRAMNKLQPSGTKPLPPTSKIAQEITKDMANVQLNKDYLVRVGSKILKLNDAGYDVKDLHKQFQDQYAKGAKAQTISEDRLQEIYKRVTSVERFRNSLRKAGYDPDLVTKRIESLMAKQKKEREDRDKFLKTDEGIVDKVKGFFGGKKPTAAPAAGAQPAAAAPAAGSGKPSIGSWLRDNFMKGFLRGISFGSSQQQVDDILKRMPQSYKAGTLNKDLTDIASIAWAVSDQGRKQDN